MKLRLLSRAITTRGQHVAGVLDGLRKHCAVKADGRNVLKLPRDYHTRETFLAAVKNIENLRLRLPAMAK